MRDLSRKTPKPRQTVVITMLDRHKLIMRRTTNRNAHIITPHGKVVAGRKGRKG
ncbi:MAG TPA: hypothetical protein VN642_15385 [Dongiaceae bacterium]|nr:hypothetical protein [Dongiaceae bacterium]